ncbi:hypothetical protein [Streptomyces flavofungini]|uniref:Uncharacterized protein n=1 Tax=Streptomyces flavofungini TaxID=68200 RepID=A0ABS0XBQ4_9ACTN|nr:hypothetical protein [Streptomyces flavofungini]MBJ3810579.1 hypothetical protein [Streptomyces flavofungini]GHC83807.1 hypothetical protein GCM10010349_68340 [Streptomyces flavofungini]
MNRDHRRHGYGEAVTVATRKAAGFQQRPEVRDLRRAAQGLSGGQALGLKESP